MCFSATASFVVGGSLLVVGAFALHKVENRREAAFAAIPVLFGLQQIVEGFVWLTFDSAVPGLNARLVQLYSLFSHVLWPVYAPAAALALETEIRRRRAMWPVLMLGLAVSITLLVAISIYPLQAAPGGGHVLYASPHFSDLLATNYYWLLSGAYVVATCAGLMLSSHRTVALFGTLTLAAYGVTFGFYTYALVSVWCFFAAALSGIVVLHFVRVARSRRAIAS